MDRDDPGREEVFFGCIGLIAAQPASALRLDDLPLR